MLSKPKVVILCGGKGTRLKEQTEFLPKPLVCVGNMPILWHIMKCYSRFGFKDFVLALGYKGDMIKKYFINYESMAGDFTLNLASKPSCVYYHNHHEEDWNITFVETGENTLTGGRIRRIDKYLDRDSHFMCTYGDGVGDVNIDQLWQFHLAHDKIATITGVHPVSKYGQLLVDDANRIIGFQQKPQLKDLINGGFQVYKREFVDYCDEGMIEDPFARLSAENQLMMYRHMGFWHCMDTSQDHESLNKLWDAGNAPWKLW